MRSKLIILGCGSSIGVPRVDGFWGKCDKKNIKNVRTRCSAIIISGSNFILIDTSPDIKSQLIKNKIKSISSVLYTHEHADQTNGLFELRPFLWKFKKAINIYGNNKTIKSLKKRFDYCFKRIGPYPPIVKGNIIKKKFSLGISNEKIHINSFQAKHGSVKSTIYVFNKTAYISDCNDLNIVKKKELKKLNFLILDCIKIEDNYDHFTLKDCLYIHKMIKPNKTILKNLEHFQNISKTSSA